MLNAASSSGAPEHAHLGTPADYRLSANLRSPRRIAALVNRVWGTS
jgi:hypothetical protein